MACRGDDSDDSAERGKINGGIRLKLPEPDPEVEIQKRKWDEEQTRLKSELIVRDTEPWQTNIDPNGLFTDLKYVAGVDISYPKVESDACCCLVVLSYPDMDIVYKDCFVVNVKVPYIPGYLAFRECDIIINALERQISKMPSVVPQILMVDGNGIYHPRNFGVASQAGVVASIPSIGVAKNLYQMEGGTVRDEHYQKQILELGVGYTFPLFHPSGQHLGAAIRTSKDSRKPVFISVGHKCSLDTAVKLVLQCAKHRIPEPVRQADILSREYLRNNLPESLPK